jgi:hypothetical protein
MYSMQEDCPERTQRQVTHSSVPLVTTRQHVVWENGVWQVESNEVHNLQTLGPQRAMRITPAIESRYEAIVIPLASDGRLHLLPRYRYPIERWSLEFPRFEFENDDDGWKDAVETDLLQLTGLTADKLTLLGAVQADPSLLANTVVVILAEGCRVSSLRQGTRVMDEAQAAEELNPGVAGLRDVPLVELLTLIHRGEVTCGVTMAALTLYRAMFP